MKRNIFFILLLAMLPFITCTENKKFEGDITFEQEGVKKTGTEIDSDTTKAYEADVSYYKILNAPKYMLDSVDHQTRIFLTNWFDVPEAGEYDIEQLIDRDLHKFYKQVDEINDKDCFTCRVKQISIHGDEVYQNSNLLSMTYSWFIYEGGAHGNHGTICYVFDKKNGKKIGYKDLVRNDAKLQEVAEKLFKEQNGLAENQSVSGQFRFEGNKFKLNDNFAFTKNELIFYYNPYEIAPYAAGLIELKLPYERIKGLINYME